MYGEPCQSHDNRNSPSPGAMGGGDAAGVGRIGSEAAGEHEKRHGEGVFFPCDAHQGRGQAPRHHGKEAQKGRGAAGLLSLGFHGQGKAHRAQDGDEGDHHEQRQDEEGQRGFRATGDEKEQAADDALAERPRENLMIRHPARQPDGKSPGEAHRGADAAEDEAVGLGGDAVNILKEKGRAGDVGEKGGEEEKLHEALSAKIGVLHEMAELLKALGQIINAGRFRQSFRREKGGDGQEDA